MSKLNLHCTIHWSAEKSVTRGHERPPRVICVGVFVLRMSLRPRGQVTNARHRRPKLTASSVRCCVTNCYLQWLVWDVNRFLNKINLPYCLVVFFVVCPRLRPFWSVFGELALFWCSTAKRKTRPNSDFRSVRRSRRIIPLENYSQPQFLQKLKAEMLQFHVHSLDSKFFPQIDH